MEYCGAGSVADIMKLRNKVVSNYGKNSKIMNTPLSALKLGPSINRLVIDGNTSYVVEAIF